MGYATIDVIYSHNDNLIAHRGDLIKNIYIYDPADEVDHKIHLVQPANGGMSVTVNSGNSDYPENIARRGDEVVIWAGAR